MKLNAIFLSAGLMALASAATNAQTIGDIGGLGNVQPGDLVLGFDNPTSEPGIGDLVVDIGPASLYYSTANGGTLTAGTTYTVSAYNAADLTNTYGATGVNGAFGANTMWTVFGGNGTDGGPAGSSAPHDTLWLSSPNSNVVNAQTANQQKGTSVAIDDYIGSLTGAPGLTSQDATNDTNYPGTVRANGTFGYLPSTSEASTAGAASGTVSLTLFELDPTSSGIKAGVDLGTFTLSSSALTFTPFAAIPEPSIYAAILGALTIGFVVIRRRSQAAAMNAMV